jgi:uncharacterized membrane protein YdjX (TVP38/TMEM64 family)
MADALVQFAEWIRELGWLGIVPLTAGLLVGSLLFVPRNLLCLVAGFVFGWKSLPILFLATAISAAIETFLSRRLFRAGFLRIVAGKPLWKAVLEAVDQEGWRVVALMRVAGPLPSTVLHLLLGLTNIRVAAIALISFFGHAPQAVLFVYLGILGHSMLREGPPAPLQAAIAICGALAVATVIYIVGRRTRSILERVPTGLQATEARL